MGQIFGQYSINPSYYWQSLVYNENSTGPLNTTYTAYSENMQSFSPFPSCTIISRIDIQVYENYCCYSPWVGISTWLEYGIPTIQCFNWVVFQVIIWILYFHFSLLLWYLGPQTMTVWQNNATLSSLSIGWSGCNSSENSQVSVLGISDAYFNSNSNILFQLCMICLIHPSVFSLKIGNNHITYIIQNNH